MPDSSIAPPFEPGWSKAVYHLFVVRVENRDQFQRDLAEAGIGTGIHYPVPLHQQKAYTHLGYQTGDFPITELAAPQIVSLPMFPQMTSEQLERVVAVAQQSVTVKAAAAVAR